jgi:hypothetical protein
MTCVGRSLSTESGFTKPTNCMLYHHAKCGKKTDPLLLEKPLQKYMLMPVIYNISEGGRGGGGTLRAKRV